MLSADEVVRFLEAVPSLKTRTTLTTAYAAGLRASEAVGLKIGDIDSSRIVIRVEELEWFGPEGRPPDWDRPTRALRCLVRKQRPAGGLCLLFNAGETPVEFHLPVAPAAQWGVAIDTGNPTSDDRYAFQDQPTARDPGRFGLDPRALAVLSSA